MIKFLIKRFIYLLPVFLAITVVLFFINRMMPGDPIRIMISPTAFQNNPEAYAIEYEFWRVRLGYDRSIVEQYFIWLGNTLTGNFGYSSTQRKEVVDVIREPLFNSLILNIFSLIIAFVLSIPIGIKSAVKKNMFFDRFWQVGSLVGLSTPSFFIGLSLIFIFAISYGWLPSGGMPYENPGTFSFYLSYLRFIILPVATLTIGSLAGTIRYVRGAMLEALSKDYIRTARSKGLSEKVVIYKHAFRNALIPLVTIVSFSLVGLFGGSAITESIFVWNGIGTVLISSLTSQDYAIALTLNLFYAVLSLLANVLMDIGYAVVDPRVKLG
jgi:peptide/nickel transport system permease protein